ncbi:hypothetical protein ABUK73_12575 [Agrobacterium sp. BA1120]|uniref:hypothetical protein n=1 Tax=Agrobacterium sp. BA1120 TaxID=3228927 RepID=UPI003369F411
MPSFCKIDVEGAEAEVLSGLTKPIDLDAFEYIPAMPSVASQATGLLQALSDYRFNRVEGETHRFVSPDWKTGAEMLEALQSIAQVTPSGDIYAKVKRT